MREESLRAIQAAVAEARRSGDVLPLHEKRIVRPARELDKIVRHDPDDREGRLALGWFYWLRSSGLTGWRRQMAWMRSLHMCWPLFITGVEPLPEPVMRGLADRVERRASQMLVLAIESTDHDFAEATAALWRRIVRWTSPGEARFAFRNSELSGALRRLYDLRGDVADLQESIAAARTAVELFPEDEPLRAANLAWLGSAVVLRYDLLGDPADLDAGVEHLRAAVRTAEPVSRAMYQMELAMVLRHRFEHTAEPDAEDLEAAFRCFDEALASGRLEDLPQTRHAHARLLMSTDDPARLDAAIGELQRVAASLPDDDDFRVEVVAALGWAFRQRHQHSGDEDDLQASVRHLQDALTALPEDHRLIPEVAHHLSLSKSDWYLLHFDDRDLAVAIAAAEFAVRQADANRPIVLATKLNVLGVLLQQLAIRYGDPDSAVAACEILSEAVRLSSREDPEYAVRLENLLVCMVVRDIVTRTASDRRPVIAAFRDAVTALPAGAGKRATLLSRLGGELLKVARGREEIEEAVGYCQEAVDRLAADHQGYAAALTHLAEGLLQRFGHTGDPSDRAAAISLLTRALDRETARSADRIRAGVVLAEAVADADPGRAADALERAVHLLPGTIPGQLRLDNRLDLLRGYPDLAAEAASLIISGRGGTRGERARDALGVLEAGRGVLLGQALNLRGETTDLERAHPVLARRLAALRARLDAPVGLSLRERDNSGDRHLAARDLAATLAEIRRLEPFSRFGLPPEPGELIEAGAEGPIVVVNVSRYRSDALLVTADGVDLLELPRLVKAGLDERIAGFQQALRSVTHGSTPDERRGGQAALAETLRWLWDVVAGPVLEALGFRGAPPEGAPWPRLWWTPVGELCRLPLHAAGYHTDAADDPHRRTVIDRVISSYTPTVRALRHARLRERRSRHDGDPAERALIVAMPTTPGVPGRLRWVRKETEGLRRHLRDPIVLGGDRDGGEPPTKARVLECLGDRAIAHFACHAAGHPADPSHGRLLLHDHRDDPLRVLDLASVVLDRARLAYLSACSTLTTDDESVADEAVHLSGAFHLAGFPHVIGTLWEVSDRIAAAVAGSFYDGLRTPSGTLDPARSAAALHHAVRAVRNGDDLPGELDRTGTPFLWAAHVHVGP